MIRVSVWMVAVCALLMVQVPLWAQESNPMPPEKSEEEGAGLTRQLEELNAHLEEVQRLLQSEELRHSLERALEEFQKKGVEGVELLRRLGEWLKGNPPHPEKSSEPKEPLAL